MLLCMKAKSNDITGFCTNEIVDIKEVDLVISRANIKIGGSLMIPTHKKTKALVIMSSGSGPQDRDETLDGFKVFKELVQELASQGIASFRYDDRGIGESTGDFVNSTLQDHSNDLRSIISFFKEHKKYPFNEFILLGHSQGGIVTANVAVDNKDVKQLILMGAPAVPLIEVVLYQVRQEYEQKEIDKSYVEDLVSAHNRLMSAIKKNKNIDNALKIFRRSTIAILTKLEKDNDVEMSKITKVADDIAKEHRIIYDLPSLTSFLYHDPSSDYEKLKIPVLGLFGGKDLQVTIAQNKDRMENALLKSGTIYDFLTFNEANHYFQKAVTGQKEEYGTLVPKFVDNFSRAISAWILK